MLRRAYLLLFVLFSVFNVHAIEAVISHAIFYLPDPIYPGNLNPYAEACWQVNQRTLKYNTIPDKGIVARIKTDMIITNDTGKIIKEDHYTYQTRPSATAAELGMLNIMELKRYLITYGKMKMKLTLTDLNDTENHLVLTDTFTLIQPGKEAFIAGPELIDTFYVSDIKSPFRKHGKQYIPMCVPFIDDYKNTISYYGELYHSDAIQEDVFPLTRSVFISKKERTDPFVKYVKRDTLTIKSIDTSYCSGMFNINDLPSGNYYLNIMIGDKLGRTVASGDVFFQRANTHQTKNELETIKVSVDTGIENVTILNLSKTFVAKYDLMHLRAILKMLKPVSDPGGQNAIDGFLKKPDELYMRYFIYNHFLSISKDDPGRAWKDFSNEIKEVNKLFNTATKPGYETDRGAFYLRYGAPTDIITVDNESGALPYEIWQYNTLKEKTGKDVPDAIVLFYRSSETSVDYRLLHTTINGEMHNIGWRSFLYTNGSGGNNLNSRAEQYLGDKTRAQSH